MKQICILVDKPSFGALMSREVLTGFDRSLIEEKFAKAGIADKHLDYRIADHKQSLHNYDTIVPLGEQALTHMTGLRSIYKWHLSPLNSGDLKIMSTFHPDQIKKDWALNVYMQMAAQKVADHIGKPWPRKVPRYLLNPPHEQTISVLEELIAKPPPWLSIDIETGRNQINTFGVAWSPEDAIAIKMIPDELPPALHHKLWSLIARLCESDVPKVMQNGIYERLYLSRYGIHINGFAHDTMCAQKFLWPELEKGLDNVGRIYTMEPYWKDDGRIASEEGKQKDWGNIRDWPKHFEYNAKDTSNTLIAMHGQRTDLRDRGLLTLHDDYLVRLYDCVYEMCARGLPLSSESQAKLIAEYEAKSSALVSQLSKEINPRSSQQKIKLLKEKGYKLPVKRATGSESADELSLKKLRLKHPEDRDLKILIDVSTIEKALSAYLRVRTFSDQRIRFMLDPHGTETGRMSSSKDPWDRGFNVQTMSDYVKQMIEWPASDDRVFMEVDLRQAESRFVAYDACEETLLGMLERDEDIHSYVAAEIYAKPMAHIIHDERQLGKKSGHGANYDMGVTTFMDSCLKEMDLVLSRQMATRVLEAYHKLFPGIRRWHSRIRNEVYTKRRLDNPLGRVRYFYGRTDDNTYREAYAYRPQSTVPDVANHLMLNLCSQRTEGAFDFWLHAQIHDSVLLSCRRDQVERIAKFALKTDLWHPEIVLPAGRLVIPTEVKFGACLGHTEKFKLVG